MSQPSDICVRSTCGHPRSDHATQPGRTDHRFPGGCRYLLGEMNGAPFTCVCPEFIEVDITKGANDRTINLGAGTYHAENLVCVRCHQPKSEHKKGDLGICSTFRAPIRRIKLNPEQEQWILKELGKLGLPNPEYQQRYYFKGAVDSLGCANCHSSTACRTKYLLTGMLQVDCWACGTFLVENDIVRGCVPRQCERCYSDKHTVPGVWCLLRDILDKHTLVPGGGDAIHDAHYCNTDDHHMITPEQYEELRVLTEKLEKGENAKPDDRDFKSENTKLKAEVDRLRKQLNTAVDDWGKDLAKR